MAMPVGKKFIWVIKDFYNLQTEIYHSAPIMIGDYKWYLYIDPTYFPSLYMGLKVDDYESFPSGWRRYVRLRLSVAKKYPGKLALLIEKDLWFDQKSTYWDFTSTLPLSKIIDRKDGFLVNGELMIVAEVEVLEVLGIYDFSEESSCEMNLYDNLKPCDLLDRTEESIDVNGFQVLPSQVKNVRCIFERHPDIAVAFRAKNQHLRISPLKILRMLTFL